MCWVVTPAFIAGSGPGRSSNEAAATSSKEAATASRVGKMKKILLEILKHDEEINSVKGGGERWVWIRHHLRQREAAAAVLKSLRCRMVRRRTNEAPPKIIGVVSGCILRVWKLPCISLDLLCCAGVQCGLFRLCAGALLLRCWFSFFFFGTFPSS